MPVSILKDDLYSEYRQEWYTDADEEMGFGLTDLQIAKLKRKYELWWRLHPKQSRPENRCEICRARRGRTECPSVRFVWYVNKQNEKRFAVLTEAERKEPILSLCMEWVKYV